MELTTDFFAEFYSTHSAKLGPDPLREDADVEVVWNKLSSSRKSVGLILMDQAMVAGIGNIYRAEILFKVRLLVVILYLKVYSDKCYKIGYLIVLK